MTIQSITDKQYYKLVDLNAARPIELKDVDFSSIKNGFIYDRKYGFIECGWGTHLHVLCWVYKWHRPELEFPPNDLYKTADEYLLSVPGTCFLSSMSTNNKLTTKPKSLNSFEMYKFANAGFNFDYIKV